MNNTPQPTAEKTVLSCFRCPNCAGEIALERTPGNELAYHCQNERCQKVVMMGAEEALGMVEGIFHRRAA